MISNLIAQFAKGEPIKLDQLSLAAETDYRDGRAERTLEASQDSMLPHETLEYFNFRDLDGALIDGDVRVRMIHVSGEYIGTSEKVEGVVGKNVTTLTGNSHLIARWTEDHFQKR